MAKGVVVLSLSGALMGCGGSKKPEALKSTSSTELTVSTADAASVTNTSGRTPGVRSGVTSRAGTRPGAPATTQRPTSPAAAGDVPASVGTLPSGEIRIRADVEAVDGAAHMFTLAGASSGYSIVVVNESTRITLAEGDPATFGQVQADSSVSVTGTASGPGRILARQVVILSL